MRHQQYFPNSIYFLDADGLPLPPGAVAVAAVLAGLGLLVLLVRGEAVLDRLHSRLPSLRRLKDTFCPFTSQSLMISGSFSQPCQGGLKMAIWARERSQNGFSPIASIHLLTYPPA